MWSSTHATKYILHIDGDAFFASCEQAMHPELHGLPVVTGKERGIAAAMSYEAKARGVTRGMTMRQIREVCPEAIIVSSDYETYSLFSKRMFTIMRRWSSLVEEYGIDEGFVDITGLRRVHNMNYLDIADAIRKEIETELGITVSVGLAPTKVLAKIGSKANKPNGLTTISSRQIDDFLKTLPVEKIWGVGKNTANYMQQLGIKTAYAFVQKPFAYIKANFTKPHQEIWRELTGESIYPVIAQEKTSYASISKTRTFTPATSDKDFVYAQLLKNLENACIKARRHNLVSNRVVVLAKTQQFETVALEAKLTRASAFPNDLTPIAKTLFDQLFKTNTQYRSTGIILADLKDNAHIQQSLFEPAVTLNKMEKIYAGIDALAEKFGKHTVHIGGSQKAHAFEQHEGERGDAAWRKTIQLKGETSRIRLNIPLMSLSLK